MKRITGVIAGLLAVSMLLCGCNAESLLSKLGPKETLYLLKECVQLDETGQLFAKSTYDYNDRGLVTCFEIDPPFQVESWSEADNGWKIEDTPCDGIVDRIVKCSHDENGSVVRIEDARLTEYTDSWMSEYSEIFEYCYEYTYNMSGKVSSVTEIISDGSRATADLKYDGDGTITYRYRDTPNERKPYLIMKSTDKSGKCINEFQFNTLDGQSTLSFEYDSDGNMTQFYAHNISMRDYEPASCSYDQEGRLISEQGLRKGDLDQVTYQYENDKLVAINGEELVYQDNENGGIVVCYKDYKLTYEPIELTKQEAELARYCWNRFCGGFRPVHSYMRGVYGVHYPVFNLNTVLLLPELIYE